VHLLAALHPALAATVADHELLPEGLARWLDALAELPPGSAFASVCETLRGSHGELIDRLQAEALADRTGLSDMSPEEARAEFDGALAQLRDRRVRAELSALVEQGLDSPQARERYQALIALRSRF
jgi:hypothetical protein